MLRGAIGAQEAVKISRTICGGKVTSHQKSECVGVNVCVVICVNLCLCKCVCAFVSVCVCVCLNVRVWSLLMQADSIVKPDSHLSKISMHSFFLLSYNTGR